MDPVFNSGGRVVAWLSFEDLHDQDGTHLGLVRGGNVYRNDGMHLGFFADGVFRDGDGHVVAFVESGDLGWLDKPDLERGRRPPKKLEDAPEGEPVYFWPGPIPEPVPAWGESWLVFMLPDVMEPDEEEERMGDVEG